MNTLADFYFSQPGVVLIPVEHLSRDGVSAAYRDDFIRLSGLSCGHLELFEAAFRAYWERLSELHRQAPQQWFPPRVQHVVLITEAEAVRPYFQPFHQSAWLLYASDFDPACSNLEFACFQFLQVERMGQLGQVVAATGANLSYWLLRSAPQIEQYRQACEHNPRPDIHAQRALAKQLNWISGLYHPNLRPLPPQQEQRASWQQLPGTGVYLNRNRLGDMERLVHSCSRAAQEHVQRYFQAQRRGSDSPAAQQQLEQVCAELASSPPQILISAGEGQIVWDYAQPAALDGLRQQLKQASPQVLKSLMADWAVMSARSQQFVAALKDLSSLPQPRAHYADQNGLCYMHIQRRELTYNLHEAGMQRLAEVTPPYERLMLGARAIHEWGHLFVDSDGVPIAAERQERYQQARAECVALYEEIVAAAPASVQKSAAPSLASLRRGEETNGTALTRLSLARIEDFQANLMAQRFLPQAEMETYVRNNHRSHVHDYSREAYFQRLARYAYEYQYLRFSRMADPQAFFLRSTWFAEQYLDSGVVRWEQVEELFRCVGAICDCYQVDITRFHPAALRGEGDKAPTAAG